MSKKLESFVFKGQITATSNKQGEEFTVTNPRKTAYIKVDETNKKILLENGLTEYTSKEDKTNFFIIKMSDKLTVWKGEDSVELDSSTDTSNFQTEEIGIACIKGFSKGNDFIRVYALNVNDMTDIQMVEQENPFQ